MKVKPNQTLILAGERSSQPARANAALGTTSKVSPNGAPAAPSGSVLSRLTVVSARPDSLIYVQAEYSAPAASASGAVIPRTGSAASLPNSLSRSDLVATSRAIQPIEPVTLDNSGASRDAYGNPQTPSRDVGLSSYLRPEQQYAQTQRLAGDAPPAALYLDVHA